MSERTVKLSVSEELNGIYAEADREIKEAYGFSPGVEFLMALSLSKDDRSEIVGDFAAMVRETAKKKKNPVEEEKI
ncbi:MAG TPA: hypothetical protein DCZ94_05325 [Lentisphaeria bacterium]|nr:hypothetical protein [Lentisphaeria bacterium]